jgi:hypothetical protein
MSNPTAPTTNNIYDTTHHSLASLLMARGERLAAGVVALSRYRSDRVDNFDGGQYEVTLEVLAEAYDQARGELRSCLDQACEDIIGHGHYAGLQIRVLAPHEDPDWAAKLIDVLRLRRVPSERIDVPAIGPAAASG